MWSSVNPYLASIEVYTRFRNWIETNSLHLWLMTIVITVTITYSKGNILYLIFLARGDFCRLLMTFANSLDPDQDRQHFGPGLTQPVCPFDTLNVFLVKKSNLKEVSRRQQRHRNYPSCISDLNKKKYTGLTSIHFEPTTITTTTLMPLSCSLI